ncbi:hypothetical protein TVAG_023470 [Trichomonas vaginalis G3]|uniref:Uncharacterized protein n=1 Tax=Trichomonas vaginalis (strain ATCC PRA-98 / G3) TaxID=412133 RepID=A2FEL8_TRIV3|nr:armadillo (ARM) repeat-containing protein family [Trichomonas vaginalis G3]EAX96647.1 hypothetical protein TVAG_023470 [Trichomonas vaginalis G3]KAI5499900.1 armadillo (ARM) repeat-containing protein family [Trichomonas vaginalis G3]|eukprot:XP_001309577.1 hypothetical protein [Trichomonas vaginalis G3]
MSDELKKRLVDDLSNYSGYLTKSDVRPFAIAALAQINSPDFSVPIKTGESAVIKAIDAIIKSKNYKLQSEYTVSLLCDLVSGGFFGLIAINESLQILESVSLVSSQLIALKIIQFSANLIPYIYKDSTSLFSIFSIMLKMLSHKIPLIQNTAFATLQQMLSSLFDLIQKYEGELPKRLLKSLSSLTPEKLSKPLNALTYIILSDFRNMLNEKPTQHIHVSEINQSKLINLFNTILSNNSVYFKSEKQFLEIIDSSIQLPMTNKVYLSLYLTFINFYIDSLPQTAIAIYSHFLSECNPDSQYTNSLLFFRSVYSVSSQFLNNFIKYCDTTFSLSSALIESLSRFSNHINLASTVDISANKNFDFNLNGQMTLEVATKIAIEIAIIFTSMPGEFIDQQWNKIFLLILEGFCICSLETSQHILASFNKLLDNLYSSRNSEAIYLIIKIFSDLVTDSTEEDENQLVKDAKTLINARKQNSQFSSKKDLMNSLFIRLFESNSKLISSHYDLIFKSFSIFPTIGIETKKTQELSIEDINQIIKCLIKDDECYLKLLSKVYRSNIQRFDEIWQNSILQYKSDEKSIPALSEIAIVSIDSEFPVLSSKICSEFLETDFSEETDIYKRQLLEYLSTKLQSPPHPPNEAWPFIIKLFSPRKCNTHESINIAFSGFSFIVKNLLKEVPDCDLSAIIESNFGFVNQKLEINISLSAIDNLWTLTPRMADNDDLWISIFSNLFLYLTDDRPDVGTAAINTCFNLISSNEKIISDKTFDYLLTECIIKLLESETSFKDNQNVWQAISQMFIDIAHCAIAFWYRFEANNLFIEKFWYLISDKVKLFCFDCTNEEFVLDSLQFFGEVFSCEKINQKIRTKIGNSFNEILSLLMEKFDEKSLCIQLFGRYFSQNIDKVKEFLTIDNCKSWCETIKKSCILMHSEKTTQQSVSKILDTIPKIMPLDEGVMWYLIDILALSLKETPYEKVKESIIDCFKLIAEQMEDEKLSFYIRHVSPCFQYICSGPVVDHFVSRHPILTFSETEVYFSVLSQSRAGDTNKRISYLIDLFPNVSTEKQIEFIKVCNNSNSLKLIWSKYCEPELDDFDIKLCMNVFEVTFETLCSMMSDFIDDEDEMVDFLSFVVSHHAYPKKVGNNENCQTWHLIKFVPKLINLLTDDRKRVAKLAQELLMRVNKDLKTILGK